MALPMDEQRILEEMERMLAADDPKLAARLAAFGQPGFGHVLRTRRARATMSAMALVLIAAVAAVIFMMSSLRPGGATNGTGQRSAQVATRPPVRPAKTAEPRVSTCAATLAPECGKQWTPARPRPQSANLAPSG
ncbi:MAG TPA: DUF3040 domain-containing protein [Streptosporangiaceae bacterium]